MIKSMALVFLAGLAANGAHAAGAYFEAGNWAAVRMGQSCHLFSLRADRHTSGMLAFTFDQKGYNADFRYEYHPWANDEGSPWDQASDYVELFVDDELIWLGDEMFLGVNNGREGASMTAGFVGEMIQSTLKSQQGVTFAVHKTAEAETWAYGGFSTDGFAAALKQAGAMCDFDPSALPQS